MAIYCSALDYWYNKDREDKQKPTSTDYKNQLKEMLSDTSQAVDDLYYLLKNELENEILGIKQTREDIDKGTKEVYGLLDFEVCQKIIRKKLPLRNKYFSKITIYGMGIHGVGKIMIAFSFSDDSNYFECLIPTKEVKKLM